MSPHAAADSSRRPSPAAAAPAPTLLTDAEHEQLQELEEAFWDYPEPLNKLMVMHYGPVQ